MKNLMVTGGCGFIGSNFIHFLLEQSGYEGRIVNVDALTYAGNLENLAGLESAHPGRYRFCKADICRIDELDRIFSEFEIDAVCHFAAESHVDRSIKSPGTFIQTNILGTFNLLELARARAGHFALFHHVSTDEVYGSLGAEGAFVETTPYRPNSPYSASKASSDHLVRAYHETYGLPTTISNCSNNYGPYQFPEKLIPLMIMNARQWKPLPVYGDGRNVRDWLFVEDHCKAIWTIMQQGTPGETYNVGGNSEMENIAVVHTLCDILDDIEPAKDKRSRRELITYVKDRPGHDRRYAIDFGKLKGALNWSPGESFASGMRKTVRWYIDHADWMERIRSGAYLSWIDENYGKR